MEEHENQKRAGLLLGIIIGALAAVAGMLAVLLILHAQGLLVTKKEGSSALSDYANTKLSAIEGLIELHFLGEVDEKTEEEGIYKGLVESLGDPYANYFTAEEYQDQIENVTKEYYGIGATLSKDANTGYVSVVYIYEGTPAEKAGLKVDDIIVSANGYSAVDMDLDEFVDQVRGEEGTDVTLEVSREGEKELLTFRITREQIELPTVDYELLEDNIGYILISRFAANTSKEFEEAVEDLRSQGMKALILDLRYNPGGLFNSAVEILDGILPEGIVVYTEDKYGNREDQVSDAEHTLKLPMAVLISENSASAAEIVAGAIRDFDWGTLIGTTTYGKGVVQNTYPLTDGSAVKLTVEQYFTPSGENIQDTGIAPDIELEYEFLGDEEDDYDYTLDNQVLKAIEVLKKEIKNKI